MCIEQKQEISKKLAKTLYIFLILLLYSMNYFQMGSLKM